MKRIAVEVRWFCADILAWGLSAFRKPVRKRPTWRPCPGLQKPARYIYRPLAEIDRLTLPSGQMVIPGMGTPDEWK